MSISGRGAANGECPGKSASEAEIICSCNVFKGCDTSVCKGSIGIINFILPIDARLKKRSEKERNTGFKRVSET